MWAEKPASAATQAWRPLRQMQLKSIGWAISTWILCSVCLSFRAPLRESNADCVFVVLQLLFMSGPPSFSAASSWFSLVRCSTSSCIAKRSASFTGWKHGSHRNVRNAPCSYLRQALLQNEEQESRLAGLQYVSIPGKSKGCFSRWKMPFKLVTACAVLHKGQTTMWYYFVSSAVWFSPFTPKSDQFQISPRDQRPQWFSLTRNITSHSMKKLGFS